MSMGYKQITCICCLMMVILIMPTSISFANTDGINSSKVLMGNNSQIVPFWTGVISLVHDLEFINGKGTVWFQVGVKSDKVNKVNFSGYLQKNIGGRWTTIETWNTTKAVSLSSSASLEKKFDAQKGYQYQYFATIKAYKNTTLVDTIEMESDVKSY